jgi:[acyl-carrier-protein] S-malonyltransferase
MIGCVFSGQGSQYVGMGQDLCSRSGAARQVYRQAGDLLGYDLQKLSEEELAQTRFTQLSVVTLSLAAWHALCEVRGLPGQLAYAGFSVGEYSAMGASGVLDLPDLLGLVRERARLMQQAAEATPGAMYAVLGLDDSVLQEVLSRPAYIGKVYAANFNCPGQVVIAGLAESCDACAEELKTAGARRLTRLRVNAAFHTPFMADAARELARYAEKLTFRKPGGPFYCNPAGSLFDDSQSWPAYLARQMSSPVRWSQEVSHLHEDGCTTWLEFGPGKVLSGLIRKIIPGSAPWPVEDGKTLDEAVASLEQL